VLWYPDGIWAYRQAAYDGWVNDRGQGIFTKRSFLTGYDDIAVTEDGAAGSTAKKSSVTPFIVGGVLLVALVAVGVGLSRRRKGTEDE